MCIRDSDTLNLQYDFSFTNSSVKTVNFDHSGASTSSVAPFLDNTELGDSLLFVQGMEGVNISFTFPNIEDLGSIIVNQAILELTVVTPVDAVEIFAPVDQFLLSEIQPDGELLLISDVVFAFNAGNIEAFGGDLETDETLNIQRYRLNLSSVVQQMILGQADNEVVMTLLVSNQRANRSVIFGPQHSMFPAKLNITFTDN